MHFHENSKPINKNDINNDNLIETKIYKLTKDNKSFEIKVLATQENIHFSYSNKYEIKFHYKDLSKLTKLLFESAEESSKFINNLFTQNKIIIKEYIINEKLTLQLSIPDYISNQNKNIEINLLHNKTNKDFLINNLITKTNDQQKEILTLKSEILSLKEKISKINLKKNYEFDIIQNISSNSYICYEIDKTFTIIPSLDKVLYLIFSSFQKSIICYNINTNQKICEIKNAHENENISSFDNCSTSTKNLLMSIAAKTNHIKIWDIKNWICVLNIKNIYNNGNLLSACFLNYNSNIYIITSNYHPKIPSPIKIFDFNGNTLSEIIGSNEFTLFIDIFYENNNNYYIITGNMKYMKSYYKRKIYKRYFDRNSINNNNDNGHYSAIIFNENNVIKLVESANDGYIRIWNFHTGRLINKINSGIQNLTGICCFEKNNIFVGCGDNTIRIIDLKIGKCVKILYGHNYRVTSIKIINDSIYGKCFVSQGMEKDGFIIWKENEHN